MTRRGYKVLKFIRSIKEEGGGWAVNLFVMAAEKKHQPNLLSLIVVYGLNLTTGFSEEIRTGYKTRVRVNVSNKYHLKQASHRWLLRYDQTTKAPEET